MHHIETLPVSHSQPPAGWYPVLAALSGNLFVAIAKWIAFGISGSSAMFAEAVHSIADTTNQALLMVGIRKSQRPRTPEYPYGYGQERFLWALLSALGIFFVGAGVTIYHGINGVLYPHMPELHKSVGVVLGISFVVESWTLWVAYRELRRAHADASLRDALAEGDPATIAVLLEDSVAVFGVIIAAGSTGITHLTGNPRWDAIGSLCIGMLLACVAVLLIRRNWAYLLGKSIPPEMEERIVAILEADPAIERVIDFKSSVLDVGYYHIKCEVEFHGTALLRTLYDKEMLHDVYDEVQGDYDAFLRFMVVTVGRVPRVMGTAIDDLEQRIQKEVPEIKHIDIEIN